MRLKEFTEILIDAGCNATSCSLWYEIPSLHKKLFPVIAQLESELEDAKLDALVAVERAMEREE